MTRPLVRVEWWELLDRTIGCNTHHCLDLAECLFDGQPLCLDHADELLQRVAAIAEVPRLRSLLPPLWES